MKRAWFDAPAEVLAKATPQLILGYLTEATQFPAELAQISAWQFTITHLKQLAAVLPDAHFFMEFAIPRMGRRADAVIVAGPLILVLEYKVGERAFARHAIEQAYGYALDLKNFHVTSHDKAIIPILIASEAPPQQLGFGFWAEDRVHSPLCLSPDDVLPTLRRLLASVWRARRLATEIRRAWAGISAITSSPTRPSCTTTSAAASARTARRVSRSAAPGPAPTRRIRPDWG
jgi:hypothetical protein